MDIYHFNPPSHIPTILAADGGDYVHASAVLSPGERGPGTHWIGGLYRSQSPLGPTVSLSRSPASNTVIISD
jgi:hypothetical protein